MRDVRHGVGQGDLHALELRRVTRQGDRALTHLTVDDGKVVANSGQVCEDDGDVMPGHVQRRMGLIELGVGLDLVAGQVAQSCGEECEGDDAGNPRPIVGRGIRWGIENARIIFCRQQSNHHLCLTLICSDLELVVG